MNKLKTFEEFGQQGNGFDYVFPSINMPDKTKQIPCYSDGLNIGGEWYKGSGTNSGEMDELGSKEKQIRPKEQKKKRLPKIMYKPTRFRKTKSITY